MSVLAVSNICWVLILNDRLALNMPSKFDVYFRLENSTKGFAHRTEVALFPLVPPASRLNKDTIEHQLGQQGTYCYVYCASYSEQLRRADE